MSRIIFCARVTVPTMVTSHFFVISTNRFPCCGKAYPCDVCHEDDIKGDHEMKVANKMICGFCSKEQVCVCLQ